MCDTVTAQVARDPVVLRHYGTFFQALGSNEHGCGAKKQPGHAATTTTQSFCVVDRRKSLDRVCALKAAA